MFEAVEAVPRIPGKILEGLRSWARGDDDPDWGQKGGKKGGKSDAKKPW